MQSLITSYLLQNKECTLNGIGSLQIQTIPATVNSNTKAMLPPVEEINFKDDRNSDDAGLIKYIADKKNISLDEAKNIYTNFCNDWKSRIEAGEELMLEPFGAIKKSADGKSYFERKELFNFYPTVPVEEIYQSATAKLENGNDLNKDAISNNPVEDEEVVVERSPWGWWAAILLAIAFAVIFFQLKDKKLNGSSIGNQKKIIADSASATYKVSK